MPDRRNGSYATHPVGQSCYESLITRAKGQDMDDTSKNEDLVSDGAQHFDSFAAIVEDARRRGSQEPRPIRCPKDEAILTWIGSRDDLSRQYFVCTRCFTRYREDDVAPGMVYIPAGDTKIELQKKAIRAEQARRKAAKDAQT